MKKKKIGIVGGISLASTIQYYETITNMYYEKFKDYYYPEIYIHSLDFQYFTDLENDKKTMEYISYIVKSIESLKAAGVDFIIMAANSPHSVLGEIVEKIDIPILSIVASVEKEAKIKKMKRLLLTGIKYTMESDFYPKQLNRSGIEVVVPNKKEQDIINHIIFDELAIHEVKEKSKLEFKSIIESYDLDGVILGCTELPILLRQEESRIPLLNSLFLHCKDALDYSMLA